jgi:hypothetical protein
MSKKLAISLSILISTVGLLTAASDFSYFPNGEGITVTGYLGAPTDRFIIPAMIDGLAVTEIGASVFENTWGFFDTLIEVDIPDSVVRIGESAFFSCHGISQIRLPRNLKEIGYGAVSFTGLTEIIIPQSVTLIERGAFRLPEFGGISGFKSEPILQQLWRCSI